MSNTKLLSKKTWQHLGPAADCIDVLLISVDGATPKTLEKLRRGLSWDAMINGLEFASDLRRNSKISVITLNFVLQKDNFREIPQLIELCSKYLIDNLAVFPINAHGSYTNEEFLDLNVGNLRHPLNAELRKVKEDAKLLLAQMHDDEKEILAQGRIVPNLHM